MPLYIDIQRKLRQLIKYHILKNNKIGDILELCGGKGSTNQAHISRLRSLRKELKFEERDLKTLVSFLALESWEP